MVKVPVTCDEDTDCPSGDFCKSDGTRSPKLPDGSACTTSNQCRNDDCEETTCTSFTASGNGLLSSCSVGEGRGARGSGGLALLGLALGAAVARRRK